MKHTQLLRGDYPNTKKSYQNVDSKIKRQEKIFGDNGDTERPETNLTHVIKFSAKLPCELNLMDSKIFTVL